MRQSDRVVRDLPEIVAIVVNLVSRLPMLELAVVDADCDNDEGFLLRPPNQSLRDLSLKAPSDVVRRVAAYAKVVDRRILMPPCIQNTGIGLIALASRSSRRLDPNGRG